MKSEFVLDRIEYLSIHVDSRKGKFSQENFFPQLKSEADGVSYMMRTDLIIGDREYENPKHFGVIFGFKVDGETSPQAPYDIEVEAMAYMRYDGELVGFDRFKAIRFTAYQILYSSIREMVANLTARGRHGLWHLPGQDFRAMAHDDADADEKKRQKRLKTVERKEAEKLAPSTDGAAESPKKAARKRSAKARTDKAENESEER